MIRPPFTRRQFLSGSAAAVMQTAVSARARSPANDLEFGLQLFSVDAEMTADLGRTLSAVRDIGYRVVEPVGFYGRTAAQLKEALRTADLRCVSIHIRPQAVTPGAPSLQSDSDADTVLASCRELGVRYLVSPGVLWPRHIAAAMSGRDVTMASVVAAFGEFTPEDWRECAVWLDGLGSRAHHFGIQLLYHNGNVEFVSTGGESGYDRLLRLTHANLVQLEMDCGWVASAGQDPIRRLRAEQGRVPMVHVKDMLATPANHAMQLNPAELGAGIVDWPALIAAVRAAGARFAFVEQEAPYVKSPLESARLNFEFLKSHHFS
jgi:sugar phosphate isomerase/epimerase